MTESILLIWEERRYLLSIDLTICRGITNLGLSERGHGFSQLQTVNLCNCRGITVIGLPALSHGSGQQQPIEEHHRHRFKSTGSLVQSAADS
jgi:hypothetical protein